MYGNTEVVGDYDENDETSKKVWESDCDLRPVVMLPSIGQTLFTPSSLRVVKERR
jgi:hypothetical protein